MSKVEYLTTGYGELLDLIECHKQFVGISKPKVELGIDDVIPI